MAFCPQCGAEATGNFCPRCGASIAMGAPQPGYAAPGAGAGATAGTVTAAGMSDNVASALCYLLGLVTGIIFLVLAPYNQNKLVRFHAFQSIFFHLGTIVLWVALMIVSGMFSIMTHGLSTLFSLVLYPLLGLALFLTWLYLMYAAYTNKMVILPVIGPLAQKQA